MSESPPAGAVNVDFDPFEEDPEDDEYDPDWDIEGSEEDIKFEDAIEDLNEAMEIANGEADDDDMDIDDDMEDEEEEEAEEEEQTFSIQVNDVPAADGGASSAEVLRSIIARLTGQSVNNGGPLVLGPAALRALLEAGAIRSSSSGNGSSAAARAAARRARYGEEDEDEDEDDDDFDYMPGGLRNRPSLVVPDKTRTRGWDWFPLRTKPLSTGLALSRSGVFGRSGLPSVLDRLPPSPSSSPDAAPGTPGSRYGSADIAINSTYDGIEGQEDGQPERRDERFMRGIKRRVDGRGLWGEGRRGWRREVGRGVWGGSGREEWARHCIPNSNGTIVATYGSSPYIGQHSHDYSFFYTATQAFQLHLYSTTTSASTASQSQPEAAPAAPAHAGPGRPYIRGGRQFLGGFDDDDDDDDCSLKKIKMVQGVEGRWTVTDADLSRDNEWMIYSSITSKVHLLRTGEHEDEHTQLNFGEEGGSSRRGNSYWGDDNFGIWSIRFSADQKEVVAGAGSGQIMVYDIENRKRTLCINAHREDVNGVCFADENSTNVIVSASDDGFLKVWDRRSLASNTPSGVLVRHTEGITYVSPKGDGRYVISNGKDQCIRLWDLRKMRSHHEHERDPDATVKYGLRGWDYRNSTYSKPRYLAHPGDCSVMTYRGHRVLRTLIRCHFSPTETTGGQYIYTGGANGVIYIYSLDGRIVQVMDRNKSTPLKRGDGSYSDPSAPELNPPKFIPDPRGRMECCVRDVSWNGLEPSLISTAWDNGRYRGGNIAVHQWRGLGKGGLNKLEDWVEKNNAAKTAENAWEDL